MRVLGIDFGSRRLGLAVSEERVALPLACLERHGLERDLAALAEVATQREVERIVLGLPLHLDGRRGPEAEAAARFADQLGAKLGLPVELVDERWTSAEARRVVEPGRGARGRRRQREKGVLDSAAAALILRTWLESHATGPDSSGTGS